MAFVRHSFLSTTCSEKGKEFACAIPAYGYTYRSKRTWDNMLPKTDRMSVHDKVRDARI